MLIAGDSDSDMRHYNGENEVVGGGQHHARASQPSTSNEAAGEQQKNPTPLRGTISSLLMTSYYRFMLK